MIRLLTGLWGSELQNKWVLGETQGEGSYPTGTEHVVGAMVTTDQPWDTGSENVWWKEP